MRKIIYTILVLGISVFIFGFRSFLKPTDRYITIGNEDKADMLIKEFNIDYSDYKSWYKITKDGPNTGDITGFLDKRHRGNEGYREVYINKIGEAVNKGTAPYKYPAGTMIVKEEYANEAAWKSGTAKPRIKLMVKLKKGVSPETADWGYASKLNAKKIAVGNSKKAKFCSGCHVFAAAKGDYIFMNSDLLKRE